MSAGYEGIDHRKQCVGLLEHRAVSRALDLSIDRARNHACDLAGQLRRRRLIEGTAHDERWIEDARQTWLEVESCQRQTRACEAFGVHRGESGLACGNDLRATCLERRGKHASDRCVENGV